MAEQQPVPEQPQREFCPSLAFCTPVRYVKTPDGGTRLNPITHEWHRARMKIQSPCGYNMAELEIDGREIGVARCLAVEQARKQGSKFIFFLDDDVIAPHNILKILTQHADNRPDYDIFGGFYVIKEFPPSVMLWKEWGSGNYWDWTLGDVLDDLCGIATGCMLIRLSLFDRLEQTPEKPWFKTLIESGETPDGSPMTHCMTDDIYFCKRAIEEAHAKILVDTNCYCRHIDNNTGKVWGLPDDCIPVNRLAEKLEKMKTEKIVVGPPWYTPLMQVAFRLGRKSVLEPKP